MNLDIVTPLQTMYSDTIDQVTVPTTTGEITILPHHINLVTQLEAGELVIKRGGHTDHVAVVGGYLTIERNNVTVLADYAVKSEDIVYERALEAQKRAQDMVKKAEEANSVQDLAIAQGELRKSLMQLKVATRRRRRV